MLQRPIQPSITTAKPTTSMTTETPRIITTTAGPIETTTEEVWNWINDTMRNV